MTTKLPLKTLSTGLLLAGLLSLQPGCSSTGQGLVSAASKNLHQGQAQSEVRQTLGNPRRSETGADGHSLDVFIFLSPKAVAGSDFRNRPMAVLVQSVFVLYDGQATVEKYVAFTGEMSKSVGLQHDWQAGRLFSAKDLTGLHRNVTTERELVRLFGDPTVQGFDIHGDRLVSWLYLRGRQSRTLAGQEFLTTLDGNSVVKDYLLRDLQP